MWSPTASKIRQVLQFLERSWWDILVKLRKLKMNILPLRINPCFCPYFSVMWKKWTDNKGLWESETHNVWIHFIRTVFILFSLMIYAETEMSSLFPGWVWPTLNHRERHNELTKRPQTHLSLMAHAGHSQYKACCENWWVIDYVTST